MKHSATGAQLSTQRILWQFGSIANITAESKNYYSFFMRIDTSADHTKSHSNMNCVCESKFFSPVPLSIRCRSQTRLHKGQRLDNEDRETDFWFVITCALWQTDVVSSQTNKSSFWNEEPNSLIDKEQCRQLAVELIHQVTFSIDNYAVYGLIGPRTFFRFSLSVLIPSL